MAALIEVDVERRLGEVRIRACFTSHGGVTALFGPSGAGKTSVVNMIAGLLPPDRGRIVVNGRALFDSERGINLPARQRRVGYIFQESRLFPHLKVRRNLLYGLRFTPREQRWADFEAVVEMLGIGHLLQRRPASLSGGERQRVAIGRALMASPSLLLMDEPLASLDAARKQEILPWIERLRDELGIPIVYVSHQLDEVKRLAARLVVMDRGQWVAQGSLNAVLGRLDLAAVTGQGEVGTVIDTHVVEHDFDFDLTRLRCPAGDLLVPRLDRPAGARVRVQVHALDVALALQPPTGLSIQNVLPATIVAAGPRSARHVAFKLDAGGVPLVALVTKKAAAELGLAPGGRVHALIKSVAIDGMP